MMCEVPRLGLSADAFVTLALLNQSQTSNALVYENETLVVVLSQEDYSNAIPMRRKFWSGITG